MQDPLDYRNSIAQNGKNSKNPEKNKAPHIDAEPKKLYNVVKRSKTSHGYPTFAEYV